MSTVWQSDDYTLMREVRQGTSAFLVDLDSTHFAQREPIISIACPDYRRHWDKVGRIAELRGYSPKEDHQTHGLNWHGGVIRLVPGFPGNTQGDAEFCLKELAFAVELTGIKDIAGYFHWPCGWISVSRVPLKQTFAALMEAKRIAKDAIPNIKIKTVVHSDYGDLEPLGMKSYFAHPPRCRKWLQQSAQQFA